jgi:dihydrofolate synthase / folylpolyglutamate synthase
MNLLGNTLEEIAFEKAGIIKENIPVVIGEKKRETESVFKEIASQKHSPVFFAEENFSVASYKLSNTSIDVSVADKNSTIKTYQLDLPGIYQTKNILTVLQALQQLQKWRLNTEHVQQALRNVKNLTGLYGRWEIIHEEPTVVLEVAHNKDGVEQMLAHLQNSSFNQLHIIIGMVKDKNVDQVLKLLPSDANYYFTQADIPRALDAQVLQTRASNYSLKGNCYDDVNSALQQALNSSSKNDMIIVCGSIFLVAEVNRKLITQQA